MYILYHVHRQLRLVVKLQMRISDSNSQLLLLHEHIKLATKRCTLFRVMSLEPLIDFRFMQV